MLDEGFNALIKNRAFIINHNERMIAPRPGLNQLLSYLDKSTASIKLYDLFNCIFADEQIYNKDKNLSEQLFRSFLSCLSQSKFVILSYELKWKTYEQFI